MDPLDAVQLTALMAHTGGSPALQIGLIDGPVALRHPALADARMRELPSRGHGLCRQAGSAACQHGTFVAGMLCAARGTTAPAICPDCTLLVRPVFNETTSVDAVMPSTTPEELATAILECIRAGAQVLNLSLALSQASPAGARAVTEALDYAAAQGVITVAATGNQGTLTSSALTRHPWVIPVVAGDARGNPLPYSNLSGSIGQRGLSAPGEAITSLGTEGPPQTLGGTSVAAAFVTGTVALLRAALPAASAADVRFAVTHAAAQRRTTVVPPMLNGWGAYQFLQGYGRRQT